MNNFKMAWRNVWRNKRRSLVTISAMAFALMAMIVYSGLVSGYVAIMERNVLDLDLGEIQVFAEGYRDNRSLYRRVSNPDEVLSGLDEDGMPASARLLAAGLAASGDSSAGVLLQGVNIARDAKVTSIHKHVLEGSWLMANDPKGVVIGRRLAKLLGVQPGAEVVVLTQGADGSMANELFQVRGILKGISASVDRGGVFMVEDAFRELLVVPDGAHQIIVRKPAEFNLELALQTAKKHAPQLEVLTWKQLMPTVASMIESMEGLIFAMFLIVYFAIGIVILNAMLMAVFERIRELGVLKAIGMGPFRVWNLITIESTIKVVIAVAVGGLLSVPLLWYLNVVGLNMGDMGGMSIMGVAFDPIWRAEVKTNTFAGPVMALIVIVSLAVIYPAAKAAVIRPVKAIYYR